MFAHKNALFTHGKTAVEVSMKTTGKLKKLLNGNKILVLNAGKTVAIFFQIIGKFLYYLDIHTNEKKIRNVNKLFSLGVTFI